MQAAQQKAAHEHELRPVDQPVLRANGTCCDVIKVNVVDGLGGLENFITNGRSDRPIAMISR